MDNGISIILEAAILSYFYDFRDFSRVHTLKTCGGGTECFHSDIFQEIDFKQVVDALLENRTFMSRYRNLYGKTIEDFTSKELSEYVKKNEKVLYEGFKVT
jgi:hypothetical protein